MAAADDTGGPTRTAGALVPLRPRIPRETLPNPRRGDVDEWGRSETMRALARQIYGPVYRNWLRA